jgi:hypothetical protein
MKYFVSIQMQTKNKSNVRKLAQLISTPPRLIRAYQSRLVFLLDHNYRTRYLQQEQKYTSTTIVRFKFSFFLLLISIN